LARLARIERDRIRMACLGSRARRVDDDRSGVIMGARQLDLFHAALPDPVRGLRVRLLGGCPRCGERIALVGPGASPHAAELNCSRCGRFRQWLNRSVYDFVAEALKQFGDIAEISFHIATLPVAGADGAEAIGAPPQESSIMDMREFVKTMFLKLQHLKNGPCQKTITDVQSGSYDKAVLTFDDHTCLSLNATNTRTLIEAFGPESSDWLQKVIELSAGTIPLGNEDKEAILVKPISPSVPRDKRKKPKPGDEAAF
jgi:hypothetical protein